MKRCPQCNQFATDDALAFCRTDGVRLVQDSDAFMDNETVSLAPDITVASTTVMSEPSNMPVAATRLMDASKATGPTRHLIGSHHFRIGVAMIAALIVLTLAGSVYYALSHRKNTAL